MRLLVLNYEYPPLGGGAGNATFFLCKEWEKAGMSIDIVTTWYHDLDFITRESDAITVYRVKSLRKKAEQSNPIEMLSYVVHGYFKARMLCKRNRYSMIVAFFSIPSGIIAHRLFHIHRLPYTILLRGGDVPGFLPHQLKLFHWMTMPLTIKIWRRAHRVIANSRGLKELADKTGNRIGITVEVVPNGVDAGFFHPEPKPQPRDFSFLFAGRFSRQKNLRELLEQFEMCAAQGSVRLILVGDGPEKQNLVKMICRSSALAASASLRPWCSKESLRRLYQEASCFVNPSICEGLPNTLLEAMACGLPIIASNIGGNNELVADNENGFLFDSADPDGLGKRMLDMMHCPAIGAFGNCSRQRAVMQYSWAGAAMQITER